MVTLKDLVFIPADLLIIFTVVILTTSKFSDERRIVINLSQENVEKLDIIKKETYIEPDVYCRKIIEEHLRSK